MVIIYAGCRFRPPAFDLQMEAHMKYMLLVYLDESWLKRSVAERQEAYWAQMKHTEELVSKCRYLGGSPLHPPSTATTVRSRAGKRLLTDAPLAGNREQLSGFMT